MGTTNGTKRAAKGGEIGANGEFYEGGKFINTIPENSKKEGSHPKAKARKVQVAPYRWESNDGTKVAIFAMVGAQAQYVDRYAAKLEIEPSPAGVAYYGDDFHGHKVADLCARWNAGELWV
jgi:hypothetical protein